MKRILLNGEFYEFSSDHLPMLVSGVHKSGSSFLSIQIVAQLYQQGDKVIFFTAFPMARDAFIEAVGEVMNIGFVETSDDISMQIDKQVLMIKSGDLELFKEVVRDIPHISEYLVYIKNIDEYEEDLTKVVSTADRIIWQGDVDKCSWGHSVLRSKLNSRIYFDQSKKDDDHKVSKLQKYQGELFIAESLGVISVQE